MLVLPQENCYTNQAVADEVELSTKQIAPSKRNLQDLLSDLGSDLPPGVSIGQAIDDNDLGATVPEIAVENLA